MNETEKRRCTVFEISVPDFLLYENPKWRWWKPWIYRWISADEFDAIERGEHSKREKE